MVNFDYLYNPAAAKENGYFDKNYFVDKKLAFRTIENGMILPHTSKGGGIVDGNGEFIKESFIHMGNGKAYTPPRINSAQL